MLGRQSPLLICSECGVVETELLDSPNCRSRSLNSSRRQITSPPEVSNLPYLAYFYYSIYRDEESVNVSAGDAYIPMGRGIPAQSLQISTISP